MGPPSTAAPSQRIPAGSSGEPVPQPAAEDSPGSNGSGLTQRTSSLLEPPQPKHLAMAARTLAPGHQQEIRHRAEAVSAPNELAHPAGRNAAQTPQVASTAPDYHEARRHHEAQRRRHHEAQLGRSPDDVALSAGERRWARTPPRRRYATSPSRGADGSDSSGEERFYTDDAMPQDGDDEGEEDDEDRGSPSGGADNSDTGRREGREEPVALYTGPEYLASESPSPGGALPESESRSVMLSSPPRLLSRQDGDSSSGGEDGDIEERTIIYEGTAGAAAPVGTVTAELPTEVVVAGSARSSSVSPVPSGVAVSSGGAASSGGAVSSSGLIGVAPRVVCPPGGLFAPEAIAQYPARAAAAGIAQSTGGEGAAPMSERVIRSQHGEVTQETTIRELPSAYNRASTIGASPDYEQVIHGTQTLTTPVAGAANAGARSESNTPDPTLSSSPSRFVANPETPNYPAAHTYGEAPRAGHEASMGSGLRPAGPETAPRENAPLPPAGGTVPEISHPVGGAPSSPPQGALSPYRMRASPPTPLHVHAGAQQPVATATSSNRGSPTLLSPAGSPPPISPDPDSEEDGAATPGDSDSQPQSINQARGHMNMQQQQTGPALRECPTEAEVREWNAAKDPSLEADTILRTEGGKLLHTAESLSLTKHWAYLQAVHLVRQMEKRAAFTATGQHDAQSFSLEASEVRNEVQKAPFWVFSGGNGSSTEFLRSVLALEVWNEFAIALYAMSDAQRRQREKDLRVRILTLNDAALVRTGLLPPPDDQNLRRENRADARDLRDVLTVLQKCITLPAATGTNVPIAVFDVEEEMLFWRVLGAGLSRLVGWVRSHDRGVPIDGDVRVAVKPFVVPYELATRLTRDEKIQALARWTTSRPLWREELPAFASGRQLGTNIGARFFQFPNAVYTGTAITPNTASQLVGELAVKFPDAQFDDVDKTAVNHEILHMLLDTKTRINPEDRILDEASADGKTTQPLAPPFFGPDLRKLVIEKIGGYEKLKQSYFSVGGIDIVLQGPAEALDPDAQPTGSSDGMITRLMICCVLTGVLLLVAIVLTIVLIRELRKRQERQKARQKAEEKRQKRQKKQLVNDTILPAVETPESYFTGDDIILRDQKEELTSDNPALLEGIAEEDNDGFGAMKNEVQER
ncbi:unnamed protein product [Amoebophrya sp. A120]|nr:unnamed protein product [Amoebophrya sp. A120]|eukprot:GSA120T00011691001.1